MMDIITANRLNTATGLQMELISELKKVFKGVQFKSGDGTMREPAIYPQRLPLAQNDDDDEACFAPYILVVLNDFTIESWAEPKKVSIALLFCAWDCGSERTGDRDNAIMMDRVLERIGKNPEVGNFTLDLPIEGAWQDQDTYPYFYSAMKLNFSAPTYQREDDLA